MILEAFTSHLQLQTAADKESPQAVSASCLRKLSPQAGLRCSASSRKVSICLSSAH